MATQSISNMAILGSSVDNMTSTKAVAQRQIFAVDIDKVEEQKIDVELSEEALEKVVSQLNAYVQDTQRDIDFSVDDSTGHVVVRVIDSVKSEVIRQFPSEDMLAISKHLIETMETEHPKGFLIELEA